MSKGPLPPDTARGRRALYHAQGAGVLGNPGLPTSLRASGPHGGRATIREHSGSYFRLLLISRLDFLFCKMGVLTLLTPQMAGRSS